jgi:hypothetical protein
VIDPSRISIGIAPQPHLKAIITAITSTIRIHIVFLRFKVNCKDIPPKCPLKGFLSEDLKIIISLQYFYAMIDLPLPIPTTLLALNSFLKNMP